MDTRRSARRQHLARYAGLLALCLPVVLRAAPVVHWTFDDAAAPLRDSAGECHGRQEGDWSGERPCPGIFGNALRFEAGKRRVRVPHAQAISLQDNFTVECVIKPLRTDGFRTFLWKGDRTVKPEQIGYYLDLRDARPELKTKDAAGRWIVYSTAETVEANQWHHLVFTYLGGKVEIFIDGIAGHVRTSEDGERATRLLPNAHDAFIGDGANSQGSAYSFDGLIDDIQIHTGRETNMFGPDYATRWARLREDCQQREVAFAAELARQAAEDRKQMERDYDALVSTQIRSADAPFAATVLPATERLNGAPDFFRGIREFTQTVALSAARNEYEGFQVILLGRPEAAPVDVSVRVGDLVRTDGTARIPASRISWGRLHRIATEKPEYPVPFVGPIPDVIFEDGLPVTVPPRDFGALFCRIGTGDAAPGKYVGELVLTAGDFVQTIRIELTVYDFTLPRKGSLRTALCFFESFYRSWYGLKTLTDAQRESIYEFLLSYRVSPCNIYSGEAPFPPLPFLAKYRDQINFLTVGRIKLGTEEETQARVAERVELLRQIRELGLGDSTYFYSFDELAFNMKSLPDAIRTSDAVRAGWPGIKTMQTSFPIPELQPLYNTWVPLFHRFGKQDDLTVLRRMRERGDEIWWYAADAPRHPYPNFFLDYPVFDCRIIGTLSYVEDIEGLLYWCINREWKTNLDLRQEWPKTPWKPYIFNLNSGKRQYKNGMGNLVYPGPDGRLLASLRLENLRDGLEDYEYLCALRQAVAQLAKTDTPEARALLAQARPLLTVPADVATTVNSWSHDPSHLLAYRNRVGEILTRAAGLARR